MRYNYSKLRGKIREMFGSERNFAVALEISHASMSAKLCNKVGFTQDEIMKAQSLLNININSVPEYFFCHDDLDFRNYLF